MSKPPDPHAEFMARLGPPGAMADRVAARLKQDRLDLAAEAKQLRQELAAEAVQREQGTAALGDKPKSSRATTHDWGWMGCHLYHLIITGHVKRLKARLLKDMDELGMPLPNPDDKTLLKLVRDTKAKYGNVASKILLETQQPVVARKPKK